MRSFVVTLLGAGAALSVAGQALAQAPAPAPAAPVPDQMPFDIPYGPAITADRAAKVVAAPPL
jgi:glc operon protein GlcG